MNQVQPPARADKSDWDLSIVLGRLPEAIWRHKWYLVASLLIAVALGSAYLLQATPIYNVQARVLVQRKGLPLEQTGPMRDEKEFLATQAEIICSPEVLREVVQSLPVPSPDGSETDPFKLILASLSVNPVLGTNVLSVGFRGPDPQEAIRLVEAVINSYRHYIQKMAHDSHSETLHLLTLSEQELRGELRKLEEQYQELHRNSPLLGQGKEASSVQQDVLTHLGQKLTETKNRRIDLENQLQAMAWSRQPAPRPWVSHDIASDDEAGAAWRHDRPPVLSAAIHRVSQQDSGLPALPRVGNLTGVGDPAKIQEELWRAQVREKQLAQNYGPKHAEMRAVQEQITWWEKLLRDTLDAAPAALEQELMAVKLNERRLTELYRDEFERTKALDDYLLKEQQALKAIQSVQAIHESTLTRLRQWQLNDQVLAAGQGGVTVQVLEGPAHEVRQIWPRSTLVLSVCTMMGLLGGLGLISLVDYMDPKRRSS